MRFLLIPIFVVMLIPAAFAIEPNSELNLSDTDHLVSIQFGDVKYDKFLKKFIPIVNSGFVKIDSYPFFLSESNTIVKEYGTGSFVIKTKNLDFVLISSDSSHRLLYPSVIGIKKISLTEFTPETFPVKDEPTDRGELEIIINSARIGYLDRFYYFYVKVFEPGVNTISSYQNTEGKIYDAEVSAKIISPTGEIVYSINGTTGESGMYTNFWKIPYNIRSNAEYTLEITSGINSVSKSFYVEHYPIDSGTSSP